MALGAAHSMLVERRGIDTWASARLEVRRPTDEVFHFWRNPVNLTRFLGRLRAVELLGNDESRWTAGVKGAPSASWVVVASVDETAGTIRWEATGADSGTMSALCKCSSLDAGAATQVEWTLVVREATHPAELLGPDAEGTLVADMTRFVEVMHPTDFR